MELTYTELEICSNRTRHKFSSKSKNSKQIDDYLLWSILNILVFNLILGICALYFSLQTRNEIKKNLIECAEKSSNRAMKFNQASTIAGILWYIILFVAVVLTISHVINFIETNESFFDIAKWFLLILL